MTNAPNALSNALRLKLDLRFIMCLVPDLECDCPKFCLHPSHEPQTHERCLPNAPRFAGAAFHLNAFYSVVAIGGQS